VRSSLLSLILLPVFAAAAEPDFPPGWLPIQKLEADKPAWSDFRKVEDKVHLYLPAGVKQYRGVFVCFVFHSQDPRELADLWQFAMVTIPWPFEYDLGHNDKRNGRFKVGHPVGNTGYLLKYLEVAAKETNHPELAVAPMVGWVGQNGSHIGNDLWTRAPDRIIAWADSFPNTLAKYPGFTKAVPFAYAWEFSKKDEADRLAEREAKRTTVDGKPTPPADLRARANTYGFPHGIYSKFSYFAAYLDRCIAARLPPELPPAGQPVTLKPLKWSDGWAGDFNAVGEWNPIAPVAEAKGMVDPQWFPDAYAAHMWRAYHTAKPDLKLTAPIVEYRKKDGKWGGPECGLGYGGIVATGTSLAFAAEGKGEYAKVEFRSGDRILGTTGNAPWKLDGVKLDRGLHALYAVGIRADGTMSSSRAAFLIVK
jgi:hypothetical protein